MVCYESFCSTVSVQAEFYTATSNDAWGPTGTEMSEIAQMTFNGSVCSLLGEQLWLIEAAPTTFTRLWTCWTKE